MSLTLIITLAIIAAIVFYIVSIYNRLVSLRNRFQNGFAQIEVQLKRRHDLIPNLVETAKGYLSHERETQRQRGSRRRRRTLVVLRQLPILVVLRVR